MHTGDYHYHAKQVLALEPAPRFTEVLVGGINGLLNITGLLIITPRIPASPAGNKQPAGYPDRSRKA
jgi:hypothetical protein